MNKRMFLSLFILFSPFSIQTHDTPDHVVIIGGGFVGAMETYFAYLDAKKDNRPLKITIYEKNESVTDTTSVNIFPSLSCNEISAVVPRGPVLRSKMEIPFSMPGGIRVDDVPSISNTDSTNNFVSQVVQYSSDETVDMQRSQLLLQMGKMSMNLWGKIYQTADPELQEIFRSSNLHLCHESSSDSKTLHDGYRIDLLYNMKDAQHEAVQLKKANEQLGYTHSALLTPTEVMNIDPFLTDFCKQHATPDSSGILQWHNDTAALWRPAGCLYAPSFIPKFYTYMRNIMGTHHDASGNTHDNFQIKFRKKVVGLQFTKNHLQQTSIAGLEFEDGSTFQPTKNERIEYVFCPGESVGTLQKLGLQEPAFAGFAGASLRLNIDIPTDQQTAYASCNHYMEVYQEGVILSWQTRTIDNTLVIGVAGTKAFYSDQTPHKDHAFAKNRNLLQLNMINNVLPQSISWTLGYDTTGKTLTETDLNYLETHNIAKRWAGVRAVAYDGFPTVGHVYHENNQIINARCTTHLGSGGVSFGPAAVMVSRSVMHNQSDTDELVQQILECGKSTRTA